MQKIKVGIFFGGISPEHEVSLMSVGGIISNIDKSKFKVVEIFIDKEGVFWTGKNVLAKVESHDFKTLVKLDLNTLVKKIDAAFPILHGKGGEDGSIQGMLETLGIPYVGARVVASALCLDKALFNQLMWVNGIAKPEFIVLDYERDSKKIINHKIRQIKQRIKPPIFVKPARTGSSVGISKIKKFSEMIKAINLAKKFDLKIIIEQSIEQGKEIEISVLGNSKENYAVSLPGRIIPHKEFYDYNDKYKDNKTMFELPAKLSPSKIREIQSIALRAYTVANCQGFARVDFLLDKKQKVYINEINTIPGFTPISMYPRMWEVSGLSYKRLITKLIQLAV